MDQAKLMRQLDTAGADRTCDPTSCGNAVTLVPSSVVVRPAPCGSVVLLMHTGRCCPALAGPALWVQCTLAGLAAQAVTPHAHVYALRPPGKSTRLDRRRAHRTHAAGRADRFHRVYVCVCVCE